MSSRPAPTFDDPDTLPKLPAWVTSGRAQTSDHVAFLSGAALAHLDVLLNCDDVPQALLRDRLALRSAEACVGFSGRMESMADLRDEIHLIRPGDLPGPAGKLCLSWQRAVERGVSIKALCRVVPEHNAQQLERWLDAGRVAPVSRAAAVLEAVLADAPRSETAGLILADAALAQALGWKHLVPLLALGLTQKDLRKRGDDLRFSCHQAVNKAVKEAVQMTHDLARRTKRLKSVTPKLRAKGAEQAVELFLTRDAVAPNALVSLNSDRAARRFCDRLVDLGAARELTGRDTFRLYGV
ncbi:Protein of unknown function [Sulfitobacter marinus]|uniref:DUF1403 family protein n=1 Tax=Sulfitobacter marinus TaxID=394264 RepID=A0A1I6VC94_9RHOB|nr:DUF1403 family protein [Sulfitobacter marinus]SFT11363.1 Protein of unknown function [Sulfitobacter marinus]